jgi:hypothetical protein
VLVEIVPHASMGVVKLGAKRAELPAEAVVRNEVGELHGIPVDRGAPVEELKRKFGPCSKVGGFLGGTFFDCASGVTLGLDFDASEATVQIRLVSR